MPKLNAAQKARSLEQKKYLYAVYLNGKHVKYLSAKGIVRARIQFKDYLASKGVSESDGYELKSL